ncbi:fungal-specific transcription factor domain-containing protein [Aspergillus heterothallicus]
MPRPKVSDKDRRRIAKACLHCQSTKQKCDGNTPCSACVRHRRSESCAYSDHVRSYGHRRRRRRPQKAALNSPLNDAEGTIDIAVPKLPQSLYDTQGKVVYLGDCSALSFLQNIQELIEREAQSPSNSIQTQEFEELPPDPDERSLSYTGNVQDLSELIKTFFTVTSGVLDMIEPTDAETLLDHWVHGTLNANRGSEAVLYLILAYAAQAQSSTVLDRRRAHSFYHHGRHIALLHLTDDPSIETVQAFILISLYMLGCSRRNGAFLNLGIAISAAKALGLHRQETNRSFPASEARLRERLWATLRYHDLFFCAMMGRTSSTITTDCTVSPTPLPATTHNTSPTQESAMTLSAHAFSFMERTVNEIYTKRTVSMGVLKGLAQELRQAIADLPAVFTQAQSRISKEVLLRNANVLCSYHFSMMLLTRPFVVASLRTHLSSNSNTDNESVYGELTTNALSCIDAAIETVRILYHLLVSQALLSNMPLTVAWTFVSSLTICSAYFGQLGVVQANEEAIAQARQMLDHFAVSSPQARRYSGILAKLSDAATRTRRGTFAEQEVEPVNAIEDLSMLDSWDMSNFDVDVFPLDLGGAESLWDLNWVGLLM